MAPPLTTDWAAITRWTRRGFSQVLISLRVFSTTVCLERARKLCKTRLLHGPKFREAGETYIQVSDICLTEGKQSQYISPSKYVLSHCLPSGTVAEAVKYLELALECFVAADEKILAAKTSEDVVRLTLSEDFSDSDLIEKVTSFHEGTRGEGGQHLGLLVEYSNLE